MSLEQLATEVLRLRYWQHVVNEELKRKAFRIPIHLAIGHEAVAVAVSHAMQPADQLVLSHRNIAYNLARAGSLKPIDDEYRLSRTGLAGGRLGSMNLSNPARGVVYASSILGNNLPVACGLALAQQILGEEGVVMVVTGDGGMEEGQFYESLVFAKSQSLRVLFVVENNNQSMSSTIEERRCPISLTTMCAGLGIPFRRLSGNDVADYVAAFRACRASLLQETTPLGVEVELAALNQHAGPTPGWPDDPKSIDLENGLIVERSVNDPVFVLEQRLKTMAFSRLCDEVLSEKWDR